MDPGAVRRFREAHGLTHEALADLVYATPLEVAAWEDGSVRVPRIQARRLRRRDAADRRARLAAAAGLPGCAWADAHAPGLHATLLEDASAFYRQSPEARSHVRGCPACARVHEFARGLAHVGPEPGLGTDPRESLEHWFDTAPRTLLYPLLFGPGTVLAAGAALLGFRLSAWGVPDVWVTWATLLLWSGLALTVVAALLLLVTAGGRNAKGDDAAGAGQGEAVPGALAPPDPLAEASVVPPLHAEPAPRSARPG